MSRAPIGGADVADPSRHPSLSGEARSGVDATNGSVALLAGVCEGPYPVCVAWRSGDGALAARQEHPAPTGVPD